MRGKEQRGVEDPSVFTNTLLIFIIAYLHGVFTLEAYEYGPIVIVDENGLRLSPEAKSHDAIVDSGPAKPVVIIDENEARKFSMPTLSSKKRKASGISRGQHNKRPAKGNTRVFSVTDNADRGNMTKRRPRHCSTIFIHGRCPTDNASETDEMEKTFWVPENDIKYFGENTLDTTTLLNISEKFDSSASATDHRSGRQMSEKPISKPYTTMNKEIPNNFSNAPGSISAKSIKQSAANFTALNDYKIGLYKISKITNNGNDSKNGRPLAVNISVGNPLSTSNTRTTRRKSFSLKTNVSFAEMKVPALLDQTSKVKGKLRMSRMEINRTGLISNKTHASAVEIFYPHLKAVNQKFIDESAIKLNTTLCQNNGKRFTKITSNEKNKTKTIQTTHTENRKPTEKRDAPIFYNVTLVTEKERNATLHAFYDPNKHKTSAHKKESVTRTAVFKPLIPVVFKTVPNLVDTVLFKVDDIKEPFPSSGKTTMFIHPKPLNETTSEKKTEVPNPKSAVNNSMIDGSSNVPQTVRLVLPPSTPSESYGNEVTNSPIIGKTFQLQDTLGEPNKVPEQVSKTFSPLNITDTPAPILELKLKNDDISLFFREKNRKTKASVSSQGKLKEELDAKNITIIMKNDPPVVGDPLSASDIEGVREELESLPIKTSSGNPPLPESTVDSLKESSLNDLPDLLFHTRISVHDQATEESDSMTKSLNDPNYDNDTVASGVTNNIVAASKKEGSEKSLTEHASLQHFTATNDTYNQPTIDINENVNTTRTQVHTNYATPVNQEHTSTNNDGMKVIAVTNATNIPAGITDMEMKNLPGPLNVEKKVKQGKVKQRELSLFVKENLKAVHNRLATFFSRQKMTIEKNKTDSRSPSLPSDVANKTINPTLATLGTKKSIMTAPLSNFAELEKIQNARIANLLRKFQNLSTKRIQPVVTKPIVPQILHPKFTKLPELLKNSSIIRQAQTDAKKARLPLHHALLIKLPLIPKVSTLNRARIRKLYNSIVMKKLITAAHEKSTPLSTFSRAVSASKSVAGVMTPEDTAKYVDMHKKVSVPLYRRKPVAKVLHPITPTTIKNLAKNLKQDILDVWPYPNYIKTPADVMLDQGLINRAKMTISTGKRLDDLFNRAVHGKDINIAYISSSLFRKMSVMSSKRHALLYNQAVVFWFNKVVTPVTGSRMLQYKVEIPNVNEDYFSRCLRNHLQRPDSINLVIYELSEMDHLPNGKLLPSNKVYTENIIRNLLNYSSNPEIVMVDFYRGNTLNKGKYCRQLIQDTEAKLANYYDCSFLSWSKSVCPYLRDDEEGFSFSYLFSGDKRHPSIIGHAQMAYILIDYIRDAFLKYMSRRHINPTYQRELLADTAQLPHPLFSDINTSLCYTTLRSLGNAQRPNNTGLRILFIQQNDMERTGVRSNIIPKNMGTSDVHSIMIRFVIPGRPNEVTSAMLGVLPYTSRPMLTMARIDDEPFVQLETGNVKRGRIMPLQSAISLKRGSHMVRFYSLDKKFDILAFTMDEKRTT